MSFRLPRLPQTEPTYQQWQIWWQQVVEAIEAQEGGQDELIQALADAVAAIAAAQAAADAANTAAVAAGVAAAAADTAASAAQTTANDITSSSALGSSYVDDAGISAFDAGASATATIGAHTRYYPQPDGSTVNVSVGAGSVTGLAYLSGYYIYYEDPTRAGGAVTYLATTNAATAAQAGSRHVVGFVSTPAALGSSIIGKNVRPSGANSVEL